MRLVRYGYSELSSTPKFWTVEPFGLEEVNLFVGPNASGKSRILNTINGLAVALAGNAPGLNFKNGEWDFTISDGQVTIEVQICVLDGKIEKEVLKENGIERLNRKSDGSGILWFSKQEAMVEISMPLNNSALVSRRDKVQHPFLEPLFEWASQAKFFQFSTDLGRQTVHLIKPHADPAASEPDGDSRQAFDPNAVVAKYSMGYQAHGDPFDHAILSDMAAIGYDLEDVASIHAEEVPFIAGQVPIMLAVKEKDLMAQTKQYEMSTGMFRALATIIHLNCQVMSGVGCTLLIDDIGEGLDFKKSKALVDLIIKKTLDTNVQIVITSNDRFVMNEVDLKYWHIVHRNGQRVIVKDRHNSSEEFDDFKYLGLSNFDFFASEAYLGKSIH